MSKTELNEGKAERTWRRAWCVLAANRMGTGSSTVNRLLRCPCCCCLLFENGILSSAAWQCGSWGTAAALSHSALRRTQQAPGQGPGQGPPLSTLHAPFALHYSTCTLDLGKGISCHPTSCSRNCIPVEKAPPPVTMKRASTFFYDCLSHSTFAAGLTATW